MTLIKATVKKRGAPLAKILVGFAVASLFALAIVYAKEARESALAGMRLSAVSVIPSIFPFLVLSDIISATGFPGSGFLGGIMARLFGIPPACATAVLCGNVCGFPVGVRIASESYRRGEITHGELEGVIGIANNPSLAFTVSAVGLGMRGSFAEGLALYLCVLAATAAVGVIFKSKKEKIEFFHEISRQNFSLASSIKNAGVACVGIASYIIFFSSAVGVIRAAVGSELITTLITPLFEVGLATSLLSGGALSEGLSFALCAFALGFSGLSVHMQAAMLLPSGISMRRYYVEKLCEGVLAGLMAYLFYLFL